MFTTHEARLALICLLSIFAGPSLADERVANLDGRQTLGTARLFSNDFLGDGEDRWRSSGYVLGVVRGKTWSGERPNRFGEILEYRYRSEIVSPEDLASPGLGDRPYAGIRSLGLHSHSALGGYDLSFGLDLVFTGPQTGQSDLQTELHEEIGAVVPSDGVVDTQIENGFHPSALFEVARTTRLGSGSQIRPFMEAAVGAEDTIRFGADLVIGRSFQDDLLVRDTLTGHLLRGAGDENPGFGLVLGADFAATGDSIYLPDDLGIEAEDRARVRAGLHWQGERSAVFYGLTWLSKEFEAQSEDQILGSIRLQLDF